MVLSHMDRRGQRSDYQHRFGLGHPLAGVPYISYAATRASYSVHPCYCSPIRSLRHPSELDPAWHDEHADGPRPEVIAAYGRCAEEMVRRRDEQCPMGRMSDAWDVAFAALFLASDEAKYIGTELVVDGGLTVNCVLRRLTAEHRGSGRRTAVAMATFASARKLEAERPRPQLAASLEALMNGVVTRTPAGEMIRPRRLSSLATRTWP